MQTSHYWNTHLTIFTALPKGCFRKFDTLLRVDNVLIDRLESIGVRNVVGPTKFRGARLEIFQCLDDNFHNGGSFLVRFHRFISAGVQN
jgi:hypothetical protein